MSKIAVVVDSTAVLEKDLLLNYDNLYVVPLHITIDNKSYQDGIDLTQAEFFAQMSHSENLPTTSQPAIGVIAQLFENLLEKYEHILYITISSGISGTFQTGELIRHQLSDERITVFDSTFTSVIQRQMAIQTLELIAKQASLQDIINNLEYIRDNSQILLVVDDLKHLYRTGRVGLATASFGAMLKIKPVLTFADGHIIVKKKIRTMKKAHRCLLEMLISANLTSSSKIMIAHANGYQYASELRTNILRVYPNHDISIEELSPVISVHTGPSTMGLAWTK